MELTDEEKTKFDALLKERGYDDHAAKVIERLNNESKSQREAREKAEADAKALRDAEDARKADEDKRKAEEEALRKKAEDEKKSLEERLSDFEKRYAEKLDAGNKEAEKRHADLLAQIDARDKRLVSQAVRSAAKDRGIIDADLVDLIDAKGVKVADGEIDQAAIDALIDEHAKAKPHLYKEPSTDRDRDENGRFTPPRPQSKAGDTDWSKASDADFEAQTERLRRGRV